MGQYKRYVVPLQSAIMHIDLLCSNKPRFQVVANAHKQIVIAERLV
jgi:hypothetical protein